jgi:DNA polymerase elongation subunit (family B)
MNTILFDIETSALVSRTWGTWDQTVIKVVEEWKILCFSYKVLGEKKVYVESLRNQDEKSLVKKLHVVLNSADIVIGHNGDKFDIRKSNAKFIEYGLPPTPDYHKIDTLKVAKKYFAFFQELIGYICY